MSSYGQFNGVYTWSQLCLLSKPPSRTPKGRPPALVDVSVGRVAKRRPVRKSQKRLHLEVDPLAWRRMYQAQFPHNEPGRELAKRAPVYPLGVGDGTRPLLVEQDLQDRCVERRDIDSVLAAILGRRRHPNQWLRRGCRLWRRCGAWSRRRCGGGRRLWCWRSRGFRS